MLLRKTRYNNLISISTTVGGCGILKYYMADFFFSRTLDNGNNN